MAVSISLFNHKGGVSKTTTTFNLGWMLAEFGKRVLMVDADPQCNLTGMVLGYKGPTELEEFYQTDSERNLKAGLAPAFESRPKPLEAVQCISVPNRDGLYLLPGHIRLAEYEVTLGIAQELSGSIQTLQNLPGSLHYLLNKTADEFKADYILIDTKRFTLQIRPYRPGLPIYIASLGPESLRMTGELADGWLPIFLAPSRMATAVAEIKASAEAAGRSLHDIKVTPQVSTYVTDDVAEARDRERPHIAFYIGGMGVFYHRYWRRIGFAAEADRIREAYQSHDRDGAARLVTDEMVDAVTIIGTPDECRAQMQSFFEAGVDEIRLVLNEPEKSRYLETIRALAPNR